MAYRETLVRPVQMRRALDNALLGGVSLLALMMVSDVGEARSLTPGTNAVAPTAAAQQAAIAAAQQAAGATAQAQISLARAAAALAAARQLQLDAATAARGRSSSVPDGLATGGLMPADGTVNDPLAGIAADRSKWTGAELPRQTTNGTGVRVDIDQTQQKSILNWRTFNVGANTTINFNQAASDWIALNRVTDPSAAPSQILGKINATGQVYVINRNGIIFGAGSQINVQSLVASTLDVGKLADNLKARDDFFLNIGIAGNPAAPSFSLFDPVNGPTSTLIPGNVTVEAGAAITTRIATDVVPQGSPAYGIYLFGANVYNFGTLTAPQGQVAMAASRVVTLTPGKYDAASFPSNVLPSGVTFRGTGLQLQNYATKYNEAGNPNSGGTAQDRYYRDDVNHIVTGEVTNGGVIDTRQGIVTLAGDRVAVTNLQDAGGNAVRDAAGNLIAGVISADTSITRNSMVLMHAATSVRMDGVISVQPYDDGNTLPLLSGAASSGTTSSVQSYMPAYVEMTAQRSVTVGAAGLLSAPSAAVSLNAVKIPLAKLFNGNQAAGGNTNPDISPSLDGPQQVLLSGSGADGPGATIDVAGLQDVVLPASYNFISFNPRAEFADMPLLRNSALYGQKLWIDIRATGTRSDGTAWVGTPLADASGVVGAVGRSINQLMTSGGAVSLTTDNGNSQVTATNRQVVADSGSVINVAGGKITFLPGMVSTTRLLGIDGRMYNVANANPNMVYVGIAGQFTRNHSRWGVTETWSTGTQTYAPGYTEGHDAGGVTVATLSPQLNLGGAMYFGSVAGERQIALGSAPSDNKTDPTRPVQARGDELPSQGYLAITTPSNVQIGATPSLNFNSQDPLLQLSADTLSGYGLSALKITANDLTVSIGSTLRLAPGGLFSASIGGAIDIAGTISAPGGTINLSTDRFIYSTSNPFPGSPKPAPTDPATGAVIAANVFVGGSLDVSGQFINDTGLFGTDAQGPAYINGGSISITTKKDSLASGNTFRDTTGSILLARGSTLDVSSGGYISPLGKAKTASTGVMAGKGGSISLTIYGGPDGWNPIGGQDFGKPFVPASNSSQAVLQLEGTMPAYGFESNGSLTLGAADAVRIGGTLLQGEKSTIRVGQGPTVPIALLTSGGFGSYTFETTADGYSNASASITLSAGENLHLQQRNLSSTANYTAAPTGTRLGAEAQQAPATKLALLPDDQRKPVNLTLKADNILLDSGSSIVTDPKATITFGGSPVLGLARTNPLRDKPALNVLLRGSIVDHGGKVAINALNTWFDVWTPQERARIDLSGILIANSRFGEQGGPITSGTVIKGGTLSIEAGELTSLGSGDAITYPYQSPGGLVVAESGLQVDVSGYAGVVQIAAGRTGAASTWLWSDAGSVSVDVFGFAWGGSFAATGGRLSDGTAMLGGDGKTAVANNGTIILGGNKVSLQQDNTAITAALASFHQSNNSIGPASILVSADQLAPFDDVFLYSGSATGGAARIFTDLPANTANFPATSLQPLTIANSLSWHVANRLHIAASSIATDQAGSSVSLEAPYVLLTGGSAAVQSGTSTITVTARTMDIEGAAFSGFRQVQLNSSGDIRLSTPKVANVVDTQSGLVTGPSSFPGTLATYGDLLLSAQRIYPVSAVDFTIKSTAGNVTFRAPADSSTAIPLSAGGSLTVSAPNIDQGGNLFAPLGKIKLAGGVGTNADGTPQGVVLQPGSLTSVTLADTVVPYGATSDGTGWYYNTSNTPLSAPPAKGLELGGANVAVKAGSTIDLRGGGDLQAMEWIPGKGGSRDTLTSVNDGLLAGSAAGPTVYALLPTRNDAVAAFDIHLTAANSLNATGKSGTKFTLPSGQVLYLQPGDAYQLVGSQITIDGGAGISAGSYTLYPAHYATLPGALRVTYYGDNLGRNVPSGTTLPDGTVLVTGNYTQSTQPGKQSAGQSLFAVQTGAVWQQYSEYSFSSANSYFVQKAAHDGTRVPRLPIDAGRFAVIAQQQILLAGTALSQPAPGGRGGELDIAGNKLAVVSHQQYVDSATAGNVPAGYIPLDVSQLDSFGFESLLIGGTRSDVDPAKGTQINPTATEVLVDTRGEKLTGPEILLVTQAKGHWEEQIQWFKVGSTLVYVPLAIYKPTANDGSITIKAGSIIETTGAVHAGQGRNYYFAEGTPKPTPLSRALEVAQSLGGTLQADGTITGIDLNKLHAFWYWDDYKSWTSTVGNDPTSLAFYGFGGPTTQQPGLGSLFAASNDPNLALSGPTGSPVQPLTLKFADLRSGAVPGVPDSGPVTALDGSQAQIVLPGGDAGRVTIEAGATVSTKTLTLQATASTKAIVIDGDVHASRVNLSAQTFAIGQGSASAVGNSVQLSGSRFTDVQGLTLTSLSGAISVYGSFDPGSVMANLTLDAAAVLRAGSEDGKVSVSNGAITLVNSRGSGVPAGLPSGSGNLAFEASEIVLAGGTQTIAGAAAVTLRATERVMVAGPGKLTLGTGADQVNLAVTTPTILVAGATAAGSGSFTLTTQGGVTLADIVARTETAQRPGDSPEIGGNLAVVAKTIAVGNTIQAQAGSVTLEATGGDVVNPDGSITQALRLTDGAYIAAGGYAKALADTVTYVAGGKVLLHADPGNAGSVLTAATSIIDVAQQVDGLGYGGQIQISATAGRAVLLGDVRGRGGHGLGGSFKVDANGLDVDDVRLDTLADKLLAGGLSGVIDIHTRTGNLTLSEGHTLKARSVTLTADDTRWDSANPAGQFGQVTIAGTIDARGYAGTTADGTGQAGGKVGLYGANQVTLAGTSFIAASTAHTDERGGDVTVGIPWAAHGKIRLQSGMRIDVSGGTKGGLTGGTVTFRAPNDGNGDAKIVAIDLASQELTTFSGIDIVKARSVTVESFVAFDTVTSEYGLADSRWKGIIDPATNTFFSQTLKDYTQGKGFNNQDYGFQKLIGRLSPLGQELGAGVVHVRPGIELVNSDANTNAGNITVKSAWNLAAGSAYNLQPNTTGTKYVHVYESSASTAPSYVTFDYRLVADYGTGSGPAIEPGALTLRALNSVVIGASISDGFFQFRDYLNTTYRGLVVSYLRSNSARGIDPISNANTPYQYLLNSASPSFIAPYKSSANVISPSAVDLAAADLFPNQLRVCVASCGTANSVGVIPQGARIVTVTDPGSWTYRITAGADLRSGNPNAVKSLDSTVYNPSRIQVYDPKNPSQMPSVILTGQTSYSQSWFNSTSLNQPSAPVTLPTMVRTGTGSINVTAAYNVFLNDPDPASTTPNAVAPGVIYAAGVNTPRAGDSSSGLVDPKYRTVNGQVVATALGDPGVNPDQLFFEPQLLAYSAPAFSSPRLFGPPTAAAFPHMGGDIEVAAQQDIVGYTGTASKTNYQYFKQWLLADSELTPTTDPATGAAISVRGRGVFAPVGTSIASQTAWWIQYGSFQQGILSAGGNVTATAGRDVIDLSVSLPTTGRVSGGISPTSTPVTHVYDSGNMAVSAGRDILGGSFYEGSGHASIVAGRSAGATSRKLNWKGIDGVTSGTLPLDNLPLLAVDLGRIQFTAGGSMSIAGVINPAALHQQNASLANLSPTIPIYMDTYGPDSGVALRSVTGNVTIAVAPTAIGPSQGFIAGTPITSWAYPASFEAVALGGDIKTTGMGVTAGFGSLPGMLLSGSEHGDFQLLAEGSIDLTYGVVPTGQLKPYFSAGPALLDKAFDPFRPNAWYGTHSDDASYAGAFTSAVLAHQNDDAIARIVAATGNIVGSGRTLGSGTSADLTRVQINRPTEVYAGGNITDLNLIVQNIRPSDVSSVTAGGNITYTGLNIAGGLQVAGPGFFVVQAGGDLGPFLPVAFDTALLVTQQQGIASVGNASGTPVGNLNPGGGTQGGLTGIYNTALLGPTSNPRRNALLGSGGADVIALFGVAKGINYKAVVEAYVDPGNSANVPHNYLSELLAFLARVNVPAGSDPLATFTSLPQNLQHVFIDQVFFAELKAVGLSDQGKAATPRGYKIIETMFPPSYGYTANDGSAPVKTGDLLLNHATLQTRQGGDISIFGPGGNILVGPLAPEPNPNLKLSDIGILTLGGGAINTFTDQSVRVNSSRVLTTQGGDVLMWSSNGDLDAGRGSKTTLSLPPLQVLFDSNDYQFIDLGGFVSGAGIGTVKASSFARSSSLYLLAPRGIVDFGVAGGRTTGNLVVVAPVVANAGNIQVAGTTTGVPTVSVPNVGALTAGSNTAGAAAKSADTPTAGGGNQGGASVFIVEVVGYGGGDGAATGSVPAGETASPAAAPAQPGATPANQDSEDEEKKKKRGG